MKWSLPSICLIVLTFASCSTDVANRYYATKQYSPKETEAVQLLYQKPSRKFEVIADFQSRGESAESLRKKAAKIGADAVIVTAVGGSYALNEEWAGKDRMGHTYSRILGTAIVYTD
jgi:hypothetical protein